jgi:tetratricopeptide (TPR) repeat protein
MSDTGRLPIASDAQNIGFRAEKCFKALCPETWLPKSVDGTDDFGIDYQVQTLENGQASDMFRVQLKGTTVPDLNADGTEFSIQLKAPTIRYYARFTEPILLVLCDLSANTVAIKCPLYHVWIHDELRRLNARDLPDGQLFVTLRIPKANVLDGDTDLSKDLSQFRALANIGASLDMTLEKRSPSMEPGERTALIEKLPIGFTTRSAALMESLSEEPATVWPDRPPGSMVWFLFEAEQSLNTGAFARAEEMLTAASGKFPKAVPLEVAEYWYLKGRERLSRLSQEEACEAFEKAMAAEPNHPKYLAAWAETKFSMGFSEDGPNDLGDILSRLTTSEPAVLSIKARILAAEKRFAEAEQILATFSGVEQLSALAIIHTMRSKSAEALAVSEAGLSLASLKEGTRILFVIIKARAQFNMAVDLEPDSENGRLRMPLTGRPGADLDLLHEAWEGMKIAVEGLRASGWPVNIEFLADILCAAASVVDKEEQALAMLVEAAEKRPSLPTLQAAVESLAFQTGDYELALKANALQPQNSTTKLRKASLLHVTKRDAECMAFFEAQLSTFNRADPMFGEALSLAITSADRLVKTDLVDAWLKLFDGSPELIRQRAVWDYFSAVSKNKAKRGQALGELFSNFQRHGKPTSLAIHLFHALNPHRADEAEKIVIVSEVLLGDRLLPVEAILQLGQALSTLERWPELLSLAQDGHKRFPDNQILTAVAALALDRLGRTADARALLSPLVDQGVTELFFLSVHVRIATRCGFIEEAMAVAEKMLALSTDNDKKIDHLRLLHHLVRAKNPSDPRAHAIAWRIGELTDPDAEINEGAFLMMVMTSPHPEEPDPEQVAEYQERLKNYTEKFPNSRVLRSATFADDATPDEMLATLMRLVGDTPEKIEARRLREEQLSEKGKHSPFAWRPHVHVNVARDLPELWEASKRAKGADQRLLLSMILGQWTAMPWAEMRDRVPLMDHLSLLVAHDLNLIDLIFKLFPKVAVPQRTMLEISQLADPLVGSFVQEKCRSIQETLQAHFGQLLQPRVARSTMDDDGIEFVQIAEEYKSLSRQPPYLLYSDDAYFRVFCQEHETNFQSMCVLDILSALERQGLLTAKEVAERIGMLCSWGAGIAIEQGWQLAGLPDGLASAGNVATGVEMLCSSKLCISIFNGMWDRPDQTYAEILAHAANLIAAMLRSSGQSPTSIASLMAIWHEKAMLTHGAPQNDETALALLAGNSAMALPLATEDAFVCTKLWKTYFLLLERFQKGKQNLNRLIDGISMLACVAANNDVKPESFSRRSLKAFFDLGLKDGSNTKLVFQKSYKLWRKGLLGQLGARPTLLWDLLQTSAERPEYWRRWHNKDARARVSYEGLRNLASEARSILRTSANEGDKKVPGSGYRQEWAYAYSGSFAPAKTVAVKL